MAWAYSVTQFRHTVILSSSVSVHYLSYAPFNLKKKEEEEIFSYLHYLPNGLTVVHIQLKFKIWICHKNTLVFFEFGHGLMITDRVNPLEL
jgi:hypothetical protein